jgi:hypothetical protein
MRKKGSDGKTHVFATRVTIVEQALIAAAAEAEGVSVCALIRRIVVAELTERLRQSLES